VMEFESAVRRLAAAQGARSALMRRKKRDEEAARALARERREAAVELVAARKRDAEEEKEAALRRRREESGRNNGVVWSAWLTVVRLDEEAGDRSGIRRREDKVVLPPSVESSLMTQDAAVRAGALLFEIRAGKGAEAGSSDWGPMEEAARREAGEEPGLWCTHAGVLNFKGADGCVGVPAKVARCLGEHGEEGSKVLVKFSRLPKGQFAALQPELRDFAQDVGDVRGVLEDALHRHVTLTVGDVLSVPFGEAEYGVRVLGLRGAPDGEEVGAVSVVDTDLEVELTESAQYTRAVAALREAEAEREAEEKRREVEAAAAEAERERQEAERLEAARLGETARESLRASLPPEPSTDNNVEVAVRMPDGRMMRRRFSRGGEAAALFRFVAAEAPGEAPPDPDSVALFKPLSHTTLVGRDCAHQTFESLGFDVRESLMYR